MMLLRRIRSRRSMLKRKLIDSLTAEMKKAAKDLEFEKAASLRDVIISLKSDG